MLDNHSVIDTITTVFKDTPYPGDAYLLGNSEGCEPEEEVGPFRGRREWQGLDAEFLDGHGGALSFFTEAGLRFFLPAFLLADVRGELMYADPLFHLTHGFYDFTVNIPKGERVFEIRSGKSALMNPRRYGAMTSYDYARYRLVVFTREEAAAIVAYLTYKRAEDTDGLDTPRIDAALHDFWLARAQHAPTAEELRRHIREQEEYLAAMRKSEP
ncbi:MAG: hypothetical protein ACYDBB_17185 [Armatimonadota bacterium]